MTASLKSQMTVTLVTLLDRRFTLNNVLLRLLEPLALCVITGGSDCYWTREWASLFSRYSSLLIDLLNSLLQRKPSFQHGKRETKEEDTIIIVRSAIYPLPPLPKRRRQSWFISSQCLHWYFYNFSRELVYTIWFCLSIIAFISSLLLLNRSPDFWTDAQTGSHE